MSQRLALFLFNFFDMCDRCKNKNCKGKLNLMPYKYGNGIVISCKDCGSEFGEAENGYSPIIYECEQYDRICKSCFNLLNS